MSIYKRGKIYWLDVAHRDGRQIRRSAKTSDRPTALRMEAALKLEVGKMVPIFDITGASERSIGFSELMDKFLKHQAALQRRSLKSFFEVYVRQLRTAFKDTPIRDIDVKAVELYRAQRLSSSSVATANRSVAVLRRAFNLAMRWGYIDRNPAQRLDPLREVRQIERVLSPTEQASYLSACDVDFRLFAWLALRTGMRRGELQSLRARDVDLWRSLITLPMSKSGKSRSIPVLPKVAKTLGHLAASLGPTDYLLTHPSGRPWTDTMMRKRHARAVAATRLPWFRFHDLRHTFASDLLAAGTGMHVVQSLLGHASIKTTEIYAHLQQDHVHAALKGYGAYLSKNNTIHNTLDEVLALEGFPRKNETELM